MKSIVIHIIIFIFYIILIQRYSLHNSVVDKVISVAFILYYSFLGIRYGLIACLLMILYNGWLAKMNVYGNIKDNNIDTDLINSSKPVELVIARYNENLEWLNNAPFRKYPVIIYNKGVNNNFNAESKDVRIEKLQNVGKCDHTYLYHIINNYDNLADVTVFLPGSAHMKEKMKKTKRIMNELENNNNNNSVFLGSSMNDVKTQLYNFKLDEWKTSNKENFNQNHESKLSVAYKRPFGKWFESNFGSIQIQHVSYGGIMAISKQHILQHSKNYYQNLIKELDNHSNPEAGHYIERAWEAVFYPMTGARFINNSM